MDSIGRGAQRATQECQYQFQWERWNCDVTSSTLLQIEQPKGTGNAMLYIILSLIGGVILLVVKFHFVYAIRV